MTSKGKKVTYDEPIEDNADYLVPLQDDLHAYLPIQTISSANVPHPPGYLNSIYYLATILIFTPVPVSQFVIGLIYIGQCTVRQFISTYMILSGLSGIAFVVVGLIVYWHAMRPMSLPFIRPAPTPKNLKLFVPLLVVLFLLTIAWWCAGQAIVFEVKLRVEFFDPVLPEYCHGNLYKAAYILIFVDYLLVLLAGILYALHRISPPEEARKRQTKRLVKFVPAK